MKFIDYLKSITEQEEQQEIIPLTSVEKSDLSELFDSLSDLEIDTLGNIFYMYFFESEDSELELDVDGDGEIDITEFTVDDLWTMIDIVGRDSYTAIQVIYSDEYSDVSSLFYILDNTLSTEDPEVVSESVSVSVSESVSRRMKPSEMNRTKTFMELSRSELRSTRAARKRLARQTRVKRKQYYRRNKKKIAAYQKSRKDAIATGRHKVKHRRA